MLNEINYQLENNAGLKKQLRQKIYQGNLHLIHVEDFAKLKNDKKYVATANFGHIWKIK